MELHAVDGGAAYLGTLRRDGNDWRLEPLDRSSPGMLLPGVPADLGRAESKVVWVSGGWADYYLTVIAFGVLEGWTRE